MKETIEEIRNEAIGKFETDIISMITRIIAGISIIMTTETFYTKIFETNWYMRLTGVIVGVWIIYWVLYTPVIWMTTEIIKWLVIISRAGKKIGKDIEILIRKKKGRKWNKKEKKTLAIWIITIITAILATIYTLMITGVLKLK